MSAPLRIAWGTPMNAASAIGRIGVRIAGALRSRGAEVTLVATDHEPPEAMVPTPPELPVLHWSELEMSRLATDFDRVVVNVGDHFPNHAGVFPMLESAPCLAVMHDMYVGNLFNGWLWWRGSHPGEREVFTVQTYGPAAALLARRRDRGELPLEEEAAACPMTEWVAARAAGALAHAPFYLPRLAGACPGPVAVAGLPVESRGVPPLPPRAGRRPVALTVGVMNPNKCVDRVIAAICGSPALRDGLDYRLVGPVTDEEAARLRALAAQGGYERLSIEGPADEASLDAALADADLIVCLRRPVLEGASASVVEALLAGRPTLTADAGCYADLPDETVVKVPADVPVEGVRLALERLAGDEGLRRDMGARGRAYAERTFTLDAYLQVLEPLAAATAAAAPVLRMARNLGGILAELGLERDDPAAARIASALQPLFAPRPRFVSEAAAASRGARSAAG